MKASVKFREDQRPIFRAKVPLNILGFPFQSGVEAGESNELCLNVSSLFDFGPLLKLSYRPNDSWRPFSFGIRTGIGQFGSPIGSPMTMSAEFNFFGNGSPGFFLHFRPRLGDFSVKRSVDSQIAKPSQSCVPAPKFQPRADFLDAENEQIYEKFETPRIGVSCRDIDAMISEQKVSRFPAAIAMESLFSGTEVYARTALPLRDRALVKLRWSFRLPGDGAGDKAPESYVRKIPFLKLSKIGVEHVAVNHKAEECKEMKKDDVAESCLEEVRRELDVLRAESGLLKKELTELRSEIGAGKPAPASGVRDAGKSRELEKKGGESMAGKKQTLTAKASNVNPML